MSNSLPEKLLPESLQNLVDEYKDINIYRQNINNTNPIVKKQLLKEELKNIPSDEMINFKLSRQLAVNYHKKSKEKIRVNLSCLTGIFLSLLDTYTYEELLNTERVEILTSDLLTLDNYIIMQIHDIKREIRSSLTEANVLPKINQELRDKIESIYKNNVASKVALFVDAYDLMVKNDIDVYANISWIYYIPKLEKWMRYSLKNYSEAPHRLL